MNASPLLVITGPTASGKSGLAVQIGELKGGEIISCDSMQIYRDCDIATAKPTPEEQAIVPHHLIDICYPNERFSAAQWATRARRLIVEIEGRGKLPIICGGTGFYLRALLQPDVLAEVEPDEGLRELLEAELKQFGAEKMHQRLAALDPAAAARLHPNDTFRVLRALEVAVLLPRREMAALTEEPRPTYAPRIFGFDWPREVLYNRINARVDEMMEMGFLDELFYLTQEWGRDAAALGGVGYKQMMPTLDNDEILQECLELWKRDTRRYAKRQMTWFRHQLDVTWLDPSLSLRQMMDIMRL